MGIFTVKSLNRYTVKTAAAGNDPFDLTILTL
jgi:hypothetical protein